MAHYDHTPPKFVHADYGFALNACFSLQVMAAHAQEPPYPSKSIRMIAPELPTIGGSGVPGYELNSWYGTLTTGGTPAAIVNRLQQEVA